MGVDALWSLEDDIGRLPQWSAEFLSYGGDNDEPDNRALVVHSKKKRKQQDNGKSSGSQRRAIADFSDDEEVT